MREITAALRACFTADVEEREQALEEFEEQLEIFVTKYARIEAKDVMDEHLQRGDYDPAM